MPEASDTLKKTAGALGSMVSKRFSSAFALDRAKLSRIINIVEGRFGSVKLPFKPKYEVAMEDGKNVSLTSHEELVSLDNAVKNPIRSLSIKASTMDLENTLSVQISFDSDERDNVKLIVSGRSSKLADQTYAEIAEQLERTFLGSLVYRYFKPSKHSLFFPMITIFFLVALTSVLSLFLGLEKGSVDPSKLPLQEYRQLEKISADASTVEKKVDFLFQIERAKLLKLRPAEPLSLPPGLISVRSAVIFVPLLVMLGCIIYLVTSCYPRAVFVWGDYEEYYGQLLNRRKAIWTVVIATLFLGAMSSLLASGVAGLLGLK